MLCQCGRQVNTAFCPRCGLPHGPPGPLGELLRHVLSQAESRMKLHKYWKDHPTGDACVQRRRQRQAELCAKWQEWANALQEVVLKEEEKG